MNEPDEARGRYRYGQIETPQEVADRLHEALEFMRSCELSGETGADHDTVIDALQAHDDLKRQPAVSRAAWEYLVVRVHPAVAEPWEALDEHGADGWELVAITPVGHMLHCTFKRPL